MARVLLVANTSWYLYNFRLPLITELIACGYEVHCLSPADQYTPLLKKAGVTHHLWKVHRRSMNPVLEFKAIADLYYHYISLRPDLVHHFTIKACLYGTIAAKGSGVYRVINAITGLGQVFLGTRRRSRLLRRGLKPLYSAVFNARRSTVIFQNADDQEHLIQLGITDGERARLIRGSGVDINFFIPQDQPPGLYHAPLRVLFPSRLLLEKGVSELLQACRALWADGISLDLLIAGSIDHGNRSTLSAAEFASLQSDQRIKCLGHVSDMRSLYASCDIVVLPSWREGLSRALIEAASMERPIITTDVPGCRDVVDHGLTGLLVPPRDPRSLELAFRLFIENPNLARRCGTQARSKVTAEFQVSHINKTTLEQYHQLLASPLHRRPFMARWL